MVNRISFLLHRVWLCIFGCVLATIFIWVYFYGANSGFIPAILPLDVMVRKPLNRALSDFSEQINNSYEHGGPRVEQRVYASTDIKAGTVIQPGMVELGQYQGPPSAPCPTSIDEVAGKTLKYDVRIGQHLYKFFLE